MQTIKNTSKSPITLFSGGETLAALPFLTCTAVSV
jgi:hypothetical protein